MTTISGSTAYQILSDGKALALIWEEQGEEAAIFMSEYVMSQWIVNVQQDLISTEIFGGEWKEYTAEAKHIEINLSLLSSGECQYKTGNDLMLEMDMFSRMSVRDLFKVINKKINQRS